MLRGWTTFFLTTVVFAACDSVGTVPMEDDLDGLTGPLEVEEALVDGQDEVDLPALDPDTLDGMTAPDKSLTEVDPGLPPVEPPVRTYCDDDLLLYEIPEDPVQRGPWAVSSRTVQLAGLTAEVWYPAKWGSEVGKQKWVYDLREHLPGGPGEVEADPILMQPCECFRDLPLDTDHGPYPVVVFCHGFSGFRGQSLEFMTHWASRGFVVLSADHPSLGLKTFLEEGLAGMVTSILLEGGMDTFMGKCTLEGAGGQRGEALGMLKALQEPSGDITFLRDHIDTGRIAAAGHSAGGAAVAALGDFPGVRVVAPMSFSGVCQGQYVESSLVIGGMEDSIAAYTMQQEGYSVSPKPRRLVGLAGAGHMAFTSFCPIGEDAGGILYAAMAAGVEFDPAFLSVIEPLASDGCEEGSLEPEIGWEVINRVTTAAFEEVLMCRSQSPWWIHQIPAMYPDAVGEFQEEM